MNPISGRPPRSAAWFAAPWFVGLGLLYAGPMVASAVLACTDWDGLSWSSIKWVGGANFERALTGDRTLRLAMVNSATYTAMNVSAQLVAALGLALLVHRSRRHVGAWAAIYYAPHVLAGVASILIGWWLFNPQIGPINRGIRFTYELLDGPARAVGLGTTRDWPVPLWLYSPAACKPTLVIMNLWHAGGAMLIFLAALLRGGRAEYEAADLDGAGSLARFRAVTLPRLSPAILLNAVTGVIFSMQAFAQPFLLSNFQQENGLLFYSLNMYRTAFERNQFGYACAQAWVLLAALIVFTATAVVLTRRWVTYEAGAEA